MTQKEIIEKVIDSLRNVLNSEEVIEVAKVFTRDAYREARKVDPSSFPSDKIIAKVFGSFKEFKFQLLATLQGRRTADTSDSDTKHSTDDSEYIVEADGVLYNPNTEDYVFDFTNVANIANVITIKKTQLLAILQDYSNFDNDPQTVSAIALKHKIPTFILEKILHKLRFRHNSLPVTSSYLTEVNDDEKVVEDLAAIRKFRVAEKYNHLQWKEIQLNANKWIQFEQCIYNPIKDVLSTFKLPRVTQDCLPKSINIGKNSCKFARIKRLLLLYLIFISEYLRIRIMYFILIRIGL